MMAGIQGQIHSFRPVVPMIYAYQTPGVPDHEGWTKIGYTERQTVKERIAQQARTVDVRVALQWQDNAMYKDGSGQYFKDYDFHAYLEKRKVERRPRTEWFRIGGPESKEYFDAFAWREEPEPLSRSSYVLRREQAEAVAMTKAYFEKGGRSSCGTRSPVSGRRSRRMI